VTSTHDPHRQPPERGEPGPAAAAAAAASVVGDEATESPTADDPTRDTAGATRGQIRGSNLLLVGRVLGLAIDFIAQILIVRYLSKGDYGAFALALSVVALGTTVCLLGLERTLGRFTPIYEEHGDYARMWGTIVSIFVTVLSAGVLVVVSLYLLQGVIAGALRNDIALALLLILIILSPLQALDSLLIAMFATFGRARSIFFRRYVVAPLLQLSVVVALILTESSVRELAIGYVAATAIGIALYVVVLYRTLQRAGLLGRLREHGLRPPIRELFTFSAPLLASDLVFVLRSSFTILLLGALRSTEEVADFRAVLPLAVQMLFVATSFRLIFTPGMSRLFARDDATGINDLYWRTAAWIALLTFPVFVVGLALGEPVAVLLFGEPYAGTGVILSILVLGYYVGGAVGFNSLTLRVFGRVRFMMTVDLVTAALSLALTVVLIGEYGALGAAIGTTASLIMQNAWYQWGLRTRTSVSAFDGRFRGAYLSIIAGALVMLGFVALATPSLIVGLLVAAVISLVVLLGNRSTLRVAETYPELARLPLVGRLFGSAG
jgi:O-antigen/teichoic acid export membrane protein